MSNNYELNDDGLVRRYKAPLPSAGRTAEVVSYGAQRTVTLDFEYDQLPDYTTDTSGNGLKNGWSGNDFAIPAGSFITSAYLVVTTPFAGGTSYNLGLYRHNGIAVDADGLDAGITTAALGSNKAVVLDGALVGGTATTGADATYIRAVPTGTFTAGKAKLVVTYVQTAV